MGRNKMNNKKTLTSLAAASMVITQAGQMSVFAKGATANPETPTEKEEIRLQGQFLRCHSYLPAILSW